MHFSLKTGAES